MDSVDASNVNALGLSLTLIMGILTLVLPRKYAPIPMLAIGVLMTIGQIWYVFGFHFSMMRVMIIFGMTRLIIRGEFKGIHINEIDKAMLLWVIANFVLYNLREMNADAFVNRLGFAYNALGFYFFFRFLIRDHEDVIVSIKALAFLVVPLAMLMVLEKSTGRNLYSIFGGVAEYTVVRDGRIRCCGPFRHAIIAGSFGAATLPLFAGLLYSSKAKSAALIAAASSTVIMVTAASGGPVLSYAAGVIALFAWKLRNSMRPIRWCILISLVVLHVVMQSPVWYLIGRFSEIVGGTGWHRSELINQAVRRFDEWWIYGTNYTAHWMPYTLRNDPNRADITNQYIGQGVDGGLLTMVLFIVVIAVCFRQVGLTVKAWGTIQKAPRYLPWALGSALFVHVVTFFNVLYFDQMVIYLFMLFAMIAALPEMRNKIYLNKFV
jgi:hypothetical protein